MEELKDDDLIQSIAHRRVLSDLLGVFRGIIEMEARVRLPQGEYEELERTLDHAFALILRQEDDN